VLSSVIVVLRCWVQLGRCYCSTVRPRGETIQQLRVPTDLGLPGPADETGVRPASAIVAPVAVMTLGRGANEQLRGLVTTLRPTGQGREKSY
jgi:hypothetical protein